MKILGWKIDYKIPKEFNRCVLIAAPHTSNWDFLYCVLTFRVLKIPYKFTIKKEWFRFPFNLIIKPLGGLAVDTENKNNTVDIMADFFKKNKHFTMAVTPEGSRSKVEEWKSGFYILAKQAKVPICLGYLDYNTKTAGVGEVVYPSEDMKKDLEKVMCFYETKQPKYPKKFSVDLRYK